MITLEKVTVRGVRNETGQPINRCQRSSRCEKEVRKAVNRPEQTKMFCVLRFAVFRKTIFPVFIAQIMNMNSRLSAIFSDRISGKYY